MTSAAALAAFRDIADELAPPLRRYLERYVGDRAVAEDLSQETLLRVHRGLATFAGRSSIKTWAFAIANRVAADYLRQPERRTRIVELDEVDEAIDPEPALDEQLVVGQMNDCIRGVIDSLPESYRCALILHDLEALSAEQTAQICDCSVATAKIRIHRARLRLKVALTQQCQFYHDQDSVFRCDRKA